MNTKEGVQNRRDFKSSEKGWFYYFLGLLTLGVMCIFHTQSHPIVVFGYGAIVISTIFIPIFLVRMFKKNPGMMVWWRKLLRNLAFFRNPLLVLATILCVLAMIYCGIAGLYSLFRWIGCIFWGGVTDWKDWASYVGMIWGLKIVFDRLTRFSTQDGD